MLIFFSSTLIQDSAANTTIESAYRAESYNFKPVKPVFTLFPETVAVINENLVARRKYPCTPRLKEIGLCAIPHNPGRPAATNLEPNDAALRV